MEQSTQTYSTDIEYISIYDRPKPKRGRPSAATQFTDEEKAERDRISTMKYHYISIEKERKRKRLHAQN